MVTQTAQAVMLDPVQAKAYVNERLLWGRQYWKPLHDRMDYQAMMYFLLDPIQQIKPTGLRRFISNSPRTAIDAAISIMTRNDPFWRIDMPYGMPQEEREKVGAIERGLAGVVDEFSDLMAHRGDSGDFWEQAAYWALARGVIAGKFQVTNQAIMYGRQAPLLGEFWDPRFVYPTFDGIGMADITVEKHTTFAELYNQYGRLLQSQLRMDGTTLSKMDMNSRAVKVEFWSNDRPDPLTGAVIPGWYGVLGAYNTSSVLTPGDANQDYTASLWLVPPQYHGYRPDQLPAMVSPVNGIPIKHKPQYGAQILQNMNLRAQRLGLTMPSWHDPSGWIAEWGRGLLTTVEELVPQYNETVATIMQHFGISAYPTWVFTTQTGELPEFVDGLNAKVPLRIGESAERFEPRPINADAYRILDIIGNEKEQGMLNGILQMADATNARSGVVLQQAINTALNSLNPFSKGLVRFGSMFSAHTLEQLKVADTGLLSLTVRGNNRTYFRIEFDPKTDLQERKYKPIPIFQPSVPEDILLKAQAAKLLLDPRMPILSVVTVLDRIFQLEDPEGEEKRMLADIANRDPVILLERVAAILEEEGEQEMADRIRQKEFQALMRDKAGELETQAAIAQIMAQLQGGGGGGGAGGVPATEPAGGAGPAATTGLPSATGAGQPREGQGGAPVSGGETAPLGVVGGF